MPLIDVPSHAVRIRLPEAPVAAIENALRQAPVPVIARVSQDSLYLDVLALDERDIDTVADSVAWAIDQVVRPATRDAAGPSATRRPADAGSSAERPSVGSWPGRSALSRSAPPVISTTARPPWSKPSPAGTPTGSRRRRSGASASSWASPNWRCPAAGTSSVVDVPGHERFVKTMVAGATGIDLFLLVVAADDGVMPQTREHLRIIELLGIPAGLVALTKVDMVDRELAELARADVEEFLGSTRVRRGSDGDGERQSRAKAWPSCWRSLDRLGGGVPVRQSYPATRMPVDRVFTLRGIGTVVTGTLWSGTLTARGYRRNTAARARPRLLRAPRSPGAERPGARP